MVEKPLTGDPEQRAHNTRVSREQSGLPPEEESASDSTQAGSVRKEKTAGVGDEALGTTAEDSVAGSQ